MQVHRLRSTKVARASRQTGETAIGAYASCNKSTDSDAASITNIVLVLRAGTRGEHHSEDLSPASLVGN